MYLEEIPDHPDLPDGDHDTWSHHQATGFVLRFPKIYDTWVSIANNVIKDILGTWRIFLIILIFLMVIMIPEVTTINLDLI